MEDKIFKNFGDVIWIGLLDREMKEISCEGYSRAPILNYLGLGFEHVGDYTHRNKNRVEVINESDKDFLVHATGIYANKNGGEPIIDSELGRDKMICVGDILYIGEGELRISDSVIRLINKMKGE